MENPFEHDSLRDMVDKIKQVPNNPIIPTRIFTNEYEYPEIKAFPFLDEMKGLGEYSEELLSVNKEIASQLSESNRKVESLEEQIKKQKKSHKYDWITNVVIGIVCAAAGVAFTIFATRQGWLS